MKKFYVSLVKDCNGIYLEFEAESEKAVLQYLQSEYSRNNTWTLPWCSVYTEEYMEVLKKKFDCHIHNAKFQGPIYEEIK